MDFLNIASLSYEFTDLYLAYLILKKCGISGVRNNHKSYEETVPGRNG